MDKIYYDFIEKLKEQTINKELDWNTVFRITDAYDTTKFSYILFSNEYHQIDLTSSYGVIDDSRLSIFLLNETFESGKDNQTTKEKNLYIVQGIDGNSFKIPVKETELLELEEAINEYVQQQYIDDVDPELTRLLREYLSE